MKVIVGMPPHKKLYNPDATNDAKSDTDQCHRKNSLHTGSRNAEQHKDGRLEKEDQPCCGNVQMPDRKIRLNESEPGVNHNKDKKKNKIWF